MPEYYITTRLTLVRLSHVPPKHPLECIYKYHIVKKKDISIRLYMVGTSVQSESFALWDTKRSLEEFINFLVKEEHIVYSQTVLPPNVMKDLIIMDVMRCL